MPSKEHINILGKGVEPWNEWMNTTPIKPDFSCVHFYDKMPLSQNMHLRNESIDLSNVNFQGAILAGSDFYDGYRKGSDFSNANQREADLAGADLAFADLAKTRL